MQVLRFGLTVAAVLMSDGILPGFSGCAEGVDVASIVIAAALVFLMEAGLVPLVYRLGWILSKWSNRWPGAIILHFRWVGMNKCTVKAG